MGLWLKQAAHSLDFSEIEESEEAVKSISWSSTFKENTNDPIKIAGYLERLAESVHKSLVKHQFLFKVVTIRVRCDDFSTYTRSKDYPSLDFRYLRDQKDSYAAPLGVYRKSKNKACGCRGFKT